MLVKDFKASEGYRFPQEFLDSLPDYCLDDDCGSPTEMTEALTSLKCSNPRCPSKIAIRVVAMMNKMGVKDLGDARARDFVRKFDVTNPLILFAYEPDEDGSLGNNFSVDVSRKIFEQINKKKSFTLAEYIRVANLPFIQSSASSIFGDYDDLEKAYADIEEGGVEFIRNKLSIKKGKTSIDKVYGNEDDSFGLEEEITDVSIRALKVYESLMLFKDDLLFGVNYVNIIKVHQEGMHLLKVKCSEEVGSPFKTKNDFYATVNNLYPNIHVEFVDSATKSITHLVWAGAEDSSVRVSNNVVKVRKYNDQYEAKKQTNSLKPDEHYIPIVSAAQFLGYLQEIAGN